MPSPRLPSTAQPLIQPCQGIKHYSSQVMILVCVSGGLRRLRVYCCRRELWRAHPSSRIWIFLHSPGFRHFWKFCSGELLPQSAFSWSPYQVNQRAYWARPDHLRSPLHFPYATVCVTHSGAQLLGADFGQQIRLYRLLVLRAGYRSRCSLGL